VVRIYINGKQVATHIRNHSKPGYSTENNHLCSAHQHYLNRSPDYYIAKAKENRKPWNNCLHCYSSKTAIQNNFTVPAMGF